MTAVTVRIVRSRHPLQGHCLTVLGRVCRHGRLELLLVLPDGSKTLVPAAWTDHNATDGAVEPISGGLSATLGTVADLLAARELVSALAARRGREPSTPQLPEPQLAAAVTLLAGLIAKAATPNPIGTQVSRDE